MTYYEVWGYDTFSREDYLCGRYTSYAAAQKTLRKHEAEVKKSQDEELRDTFCITTVTEKDIELREEKEREVRDTRAEEQSYNEAHLAECTHNLLEKFGEALRNIKAEDRQRLQRDNEHLAQEVWWYNDEDCFIQILFESYFCPDNRISVNIGISVKEGQYSEGGKIISYSGISGTQSQLVQWSQTQEAVQECVEKFKGLIRSIYKD